MSRNTVIATFVALLALGTAAAQPATFTFKSIDHPDAKSTSASGINPRGDIVGAYTDHSNVTHGFLLREGQFTTIDYPGAVGTQARGINPQGDIVGTHFGPNWATPGSGGDIHGFLLQGGLFTPVDYPNHMNTIPQRITATGRIVGCYHDHNTGTSMHGFLAYDGSFQALDGSESGLNVPMSMSNGATPDAGVIVGLYTDMTGKSRSFVVTGGAFTPFDVPGSIASSAWDMNPSGEIVGSFRDTALKVHGFLLTAGQFITIDFPAPGVRVTQAFGIDPQGDVVGSYVDSAGVGHGYVLSRTRPAGE